MCAGHLCEMGQGQGGLGWGLLPVPSDIQGTLVTSGLEMRPANCRALYVYKAGSVPPVGPRLGPHRW